MYCVWICQRYAHRPIPSSSFTTRKYRWKPQKMWSIYFFTYKYLFESFRAPLTIFKLNVQQKKKIRKSTKRRTVRIWKPLKRNGKAGKVKEIRKNTVDDICSSWWLYRNCLRHQAAEMSFAVNVRAYSKDLSIGSTITIRCMWRQSKIEMFIAI